MKQIINNFILFFATLLFFVQFGLQAQTLVDQWGETSRGSAWSILNDESTPAGNGSMGIDSLPTGTDWATIRGGFDALEADSTKAVVVKGKLEWVGGDLGDSYIPIRYAFTYQDSIALMYQNTDSAKWVTTADSAKEKAHQGYEFTPRTSIGNIPNGAGGTGMVWIVDGGGWNSTWSNGGYPIATAQQVPRNAEITAGVYNFAISVQPVSDSTNEVKWYLISEDNESYWFGGSAIDTNISAKFNGVCFGVTNEWLLDTGVNQINLSEVTVELADPITVPLPPFAPFYVEKWGATNKGAGWPVLNDSNTIAGNGSMGADGPPATTDWATIRGGFEYPVEATSDEALIVTGQIEWVGGNCGDSYIPIRYALTYQDGENVLENQYTDSAMWSGSGLHYGYEITPRTGNGNVANGGGGIGTAWLVGGGSSWNSTWSNAGYPIANVSQVPRNSEIVAGIYNFAFSVQPLSDTTSEVRWYLISEDDESYWIGGTAIDTNITTKFNGVCFGVTGEHFVDTGIRQMNFIDVHVDKGDPIDVPLPPFTPFYVGKWGATNRGSDWPILNDSNTVAGNASMGIPGEPTGTAWASIRGGFDYPVEATLDEALIVTGQIEWVGGDLGDSYIPIRYALTYQDGENTLENQYSDSAMWSGTGSHLGYEFTPRTSTGNVSNGAGGVGTVWLVNGGGWNSTWSNGGYPIANVVQAPRNAEIVAGVYDFAFSVQPLGNGTNELRWYLISEDEESYWYGGTTIDTAQITTKYNGVCFGVTNEWLSASGVNQLNFIDVRVTKGDPIEVPVAPFTKYYIDADLFAFYGDENTGGWDFTPGSVDGNASISGDAALTGWAAVRGEFTPFSPGVDRPLTLKGELEFVGAGFEVANSFRLGIFNTEDAGTIAPDSVLDSNLVWNGADTSCSGYLLIPTSGTNSAASWAGDVSGTVGAVVNSTWFETSGADNYVVGDQLEYPDDAAATAGTYEFGITIRPQADGSNLIKYQINKDDGSYFFEGYKVDDHSPLTSDVFNSIGFAVNNANLTALNIIDVQVDTASIVTDVEGAESALPMEFSLGQNYPNPFNPTTTIKFALPKDSKVKLAVYDILGRLVTTLVDQNMTAGYQKVKFDASSLASGVYFYRIEAGDFVNVKKLVLLK